MLKSINKKLKLSEELHKEEFGFFGEKNYLYVSNVFVCVCVCVCVYFYFYINTVQLLLKFYNFLKYFR